MKRVLALFLLACLPSISNAQSLAPEVIDILKKAANYRPYAQDYVWRKIPWYTDPSQALKQAREEKRPLFVWLAGGRDRDGTPLERC
jgi:hypothetical protein